MSWVYVPGMEVSSLESSWHARQLASFVTWKEKLMPQQHWLRVLRKERWIQRLSGLTLEPSTASRGVAQWISSLQASRASHSAQRADDKASETHDTSGRTSRRSSPIPGQHSSFARTSPRICSWDSTRSPDKWRAWVTELRRHCGLRKKQGRNTSGKGFTGLLPTPVVRGLSSELSPALQKEYATSITGAGTKALHIWTMEWMMGWPIGWSDTERSAAASYRLWQQKHSTS
jgi:hypothetical protein